MLIDTKTLDRRDRCDHWWRRIRNLMPLRPNRTIFIKFWKRKNRQTPMYSWLLGRTIRIFCIARRKLRLIIAPLLLMLILLFAPFLRVVVSTLPDSPEEQWERTHFPASWFEVVGLEENNRTAFILTSRLHEQYPRTFPEDSDEARKLRENGARPCPNDRKSVVNATEGKDAGAFAQHTENESCFLVQPWVPRNILLREQVVTAVRSLKPELETAFQANEIMPNILAQVSGADLRGRNLNYADLTASVFPKSDLREAQLKGALLRGTKFIHAKMSSANLLGALLIEAQLPGADLAGAQLSGANLIGAQLPGADLTGALMLGSDLGGAELPGADLTGADLSGANLFNVQLPGAQLVASKLYGVKMNQAILSGADLSLAKLAGADFNGAILLGAVMEGIEFQPLDSAIAQSVTLVLESTLAASPRYQGSNGKSDLDQTRDGFLETLGKESNFANAELTTFNGELVAPCIRNGDEPEICSPSTLGETLRYSIIKAWQKLACKDVRGEHWIAQSMVKRSQFHMSDIMLDAMFINNGYSMHHYRLGLAKSLYQLSLDKNACLGVSGLSDDIKIHLEDAAEFDTVVQAMLPKRMRKSTWLPE